MISRYQDKNGEHTSLNLFWKTELSAVRQVQIVQFLQQLSDDEVALINDLMQDAVDGGRVGVGVPTQSGLAENILWGRWVIVDGFISGG